jgi:hypothetical protein
MALNLQMGYAVDFRESAGTFRLSNSNSMIALLLFDSALQRPIFLLPKNPIVMTRRDGQDSPTERGILRNRPRREKRKVHCSDVHG